MVAGKGPLSSRDVLIHSLCSFLLLKTTNTREKEGPTAQHKKEDPKPAELHLINAERDELAEKLLPGEAAKDKTVLSVGDSLE